MRKLQKTSLSLTGFFLVIVLTACGSFAAKDNLATCYTVTGNSIVALREEPKIDDSAVVSQIEPGTLLYGTGIMEKVEYQGTEFFMIEVQLNPGSPARWIAEPKLAETKCPSSSLWLTRIFAFIRNIFTT